MNADGTLRYPRGRGPARDGLTRAPTGRRSTKMPPPSTSAAPRERARGTRGRAGRRASTCPCSGAAASRRGASRGSVSSSARFETWWMSESCVAQTSRARARGRAPRRSSRRACSKTVSTASPERTRTPQLEPGGRGSGCAVRSSSTGRAPGTRARVHEVPPVRPDPKIRCVPRRRGDRTSARADSSSPSGMRPVQASRRRRSSAKVVAIETRSHRSTAARPLDSRR